MLYVIKCRLVCHAHISLFLSMYLEKINVVSEQKINLKSKMFKSLNGGVNIKMLI